jgi:hypothetical protein
MARRKNELADKLGGGSNRPGWRDTIMPSAPQQETDEERPRRRQQPDRLKPKRKTYLLPPPLIERIDALAEEERVGISELVTYLLSTSVEMIETGELEIPTRTAKRRIVP